MCWQTMVYTNNEMTRSKSYTFGELKFRSLDMRWADVIKEASNVQTGVGECADYGCDYLLLASPSFIDYAKVIEKPLIDRPDPLIPPK